MNHWPFITAAYGIVIAAVVAVSLLSWMAMRSAEDAAEALSKKK